MPVCVYTTTMYIGKSWLSPYNIFVRIFALLLAFAVYSDFVAFPP